MSDDDSRAAIVTAQPKEHGTLFRGAMVRQLLADLKHETRRPITRHNSLASGPCGDGWAMPSRELWEAIDWNSAYLPMYTGAHGTQALAVLTRANPAPVLLMPRIERGHRIWVRETWAPFDAKAVRDRDRSHIFYRADDERVHASDGKWTPGIHMPRWACRIVLDVTEPTKPQRIGDLSPDEVTAEGFPLPASDPEGPASFREYWDRIHGEWTPELLCWAYRGLKRVEVRT